LLKRVILNRIYIGLFDLCSWRMKMSLLEQMMKDGHRSLKVGENYVVSSRLLENVKSGKKPEKKHKTLDHFFKDSQIQVNVLL